MKGIYATCAATNSTEIIINYVHTCACSYISVHLHFAAMDDFTPRNFSFYGLPSTFVLGVVPMTKDGIWEEYESLSVVFVIQGHAYSRSIFIIDTNGKSL